MQELQGEIALMPCRAPPPNFKTKRESSATIKAAPVAYERTEPAKAKKIIEMDCRGLEFTDFKPDVSLFQAPFSCVLIEIIRASGKSVGLESGTKFTGIDLIEGEWFDYDEKAAEEVSIKDIKWDIRRA